MAHTINPGDVEAVSKQVSKQLRRANADLEVKAANRLVLRFKNGQLTNRMITNHAILHIDANCVAQGVNQRHA